MHLDAQRVFGVLCPSPCRLTRGSSSINHTLHQFFFFFTTTLLKKTKVFQFLGSRYAELASTLAHHTGCHDPSRLINTDQDGFEKQVNFTWVPGSIQPKLGTREYVQGK